ncbi:hypothetical protein ACFL4U_00340 [Candidatus Neomarinimicrobiota bacterium]
MEKSTYGLKSSKSSSGSFEFTEEEENEINHTFKMFEGYQIKEELVDGLVSVALSLYALDLVRHGSDSEETSIEKAGASTVKAYSVYPLPIYLFDLAVITELTGNLELAEDLFNKFLKSHSEYKYDSVARVLLKNRSIDEAVSEAESRLSQFS